MDSAEASLGDSTLIYRSLVQFRLFQDFVNDLKTTIREARSNLHLVYTNVAQDRADDAFNQLDSTLESYKARKTYNSLERTFSLKIMPTEIHDAHQQWYRISEHRWRDAGTLDFDELAYLKTGVGTTINSFVPPYTGSQKEPDLFVRPDATRLPSFVVESGWSESKTEFLNDMNLWLMGSAGAVKFVLILQWTRIGKTNRVGGDVELYCLDRNGIPICQQREKCFPRPAHGASQYITFTRQMLFGGNTLSGRNPDDQFIMSLEDLRDIATDSLSLMGMIPLYTVE